MEPVVESDFNEPAREFCLGSNPVDIGDPDSSRLLDQNVSFHSQRCTRRVSQAIMDNRHDDDIRLKD
jgi:hypothetical protein